MEFWLIVLGLFVTSFLWALFSLRKEHAKPKEVKRVKKELMREKILYKAR